jgi:uncharacterized protein YkwD
MRVPQLILNLCFVFASSAFLSGCTAFLQKSECEANPAQNLLVEINEARVREGVSPVWPNVLLARAAGGHAQALAEGRASGHFGPGGSDPLQRIRDAGYLPRTFGENTAMGSSDPRLVVEAWLSSPGHRLVLLDPSVQEVGLGGVLDPDQPTWVADFGSQRESSETRCHPWPMH